MVSNELDPILKNKMEIVSSNEGAIYLVGPIQLPIDLYGETVLFQWYSWLKTEDGHVDMQELMDQLASSKLAELQQSSVLVYGDFKNEHDALIRMHSICHTGDIFGSKRCDCGYQLKEAMQMIVDNGVGAVFYLANHEGRGIGLFSKALAYLLQENGYDTVEANEKLGFVDDARNYDDAIQVLKVLRNKPVTLLTNNPKKLDALNKAGLEVSGRRPLWGDVSEFNESYIETKIKRSGHLKVEGERNFLND